MFFLSELFKRRKARAASSASLQVVQALCDVQRPMLRREDLERINETHQALQDDIQTTRDQARQLALNLSSELERAKMRISIISDSLMDPLISVTSNGVIVSTNQTVERILGYSASDLMNRPIQTLIDGSFNSAMFKEEADRYMAYLSQFSPSSIVDYRDLYRDYLRTEPHTILNKITQTVCTTRVGEHLFAEMYVNIFNVDCESADHIIFLVVFKDNTRCVAATTEIQSLTHFQMTLLTALPNPVFYKDADFRIIGSNHAFDAFVNKDPEEFKGKSNSAAFSAREADLLDVIDLSVRDADSPDVQIHKIDLQASHGMREVMMYCTALRDAEGNFNGSLATIVDLTDLLSMQRFKEALISSVPAPIYYLDRELQYKGCNDRYAALLGVAKDDIIGKTREDVLFGDARELGILSEFYRQKDFEILTSCTAGQLYETQIFNKQTKRLTDVVVYRAVLKAPDGKFDGIVGVVTDISEIRAVQRFHQKIFDSCPLPVFYKDRDFKYVTCNDLYADWYNIDKAVFTGKTREELVEYLLSQASSSPDKLEAFNTIREKHVSLIAAHKENDLLLASSNSPEVSVFEHHFWNFSLGEMRDVVFYKHAIFNAGVFDGLICNMVDVTDLRNAEKIGSMVLESIPLPVAYCTACGTIRQCNSVYSKMVGLPKAEILGKSISDIQFKAYHEYYGDSYAHGGSIVYTMELPDANSGNTRQYTILKKIDDVSALYIYFHKGTIHETLNLNI